MADRHAPGSSGRQHARPFALGWPARGRFELYYYEVDLGAQTMGFHPTDYVDVTGVREKKKAALFAHQSQDGERIYREYHEVMENYRGRESGLRRGGSLRAPGARTQRHEVARRTLIRCPLGPDSLIGFRDPDRLFRDVCLRPALQRVDGFTLTWFAHSLPTICEQAGMSQFQVLDSPLAKERFDVSFNVGTLHDTDVFGGDATASVDEIGDREFADRIALRDPIVAHQYWVIKFVGFDERIDQTPGLRRPFQVFIENVHGNSSHGKPPVGVGVVNFDEQWNLFDAAAALGGPKV